MAQTERSMHQVLYIARRQATLLTIVLSLWLFAFTCSPIDAFAQSSKWTSVNDGNHIYSVYLFPGGGSATEAPLPQASFDSAVTEVRISPQPDDMAYALKILRFAANKVIVDGPWTPNVNDFMIPGTELLHNTATDFNNNPFFFESPTSLTDDDEELLFDDAGRGIGYYSNRKDLYKVRQAKLGRGGRYDITNLKPCRGTQGVANLPRQSWPTAGTESCVVPG